MPEKIIIDDIVLKDHGNIGSHPQLCGETNSIHKLIFEMQIYCTVPSYEQVFSSCLL